VVDAVTLGDSPIESGKISETRLLTIATLVWEDTNITSGAYSAFGAGRDGKLYAGSDNLGIKRLIFFIYKSCYAQPKI
jgi:hypothetical protein